MYLYKSLIYQIFTTFNILYIDKKNLFHETNTKVEFELIDRKKAFIENI